jgi:predicted TIM-barrel fold metal-dependent hydrolase
MSHENKYCDHIGIWENELKGWMPEEIFDAHVHIGSKEYVREFSPERLKNALSTFSNMPLEEMDYWHGNLYSGKKVSGVFAFAFPIQEVDYVRGNEYVAETMKKDSRIKGFIWTNQKDVKLTIDVFKDAERKGTRFIGAKPYYDILGKSNFDTTMREILPVKLLEFINSEKLIMMLHTAGRGVGDANVRDYIRFISDKFPDIKIVLAHMGRHLSVADFEEFMKSELPDIPSVYLEMSSSSQVEIYRMVLETPKLHGRLLFGSDIPFGLITGMEQWSPTAGAIFRTRDRYTWSESGSYGYMDLTYNTYHVLKTFKDALESMSISQEDKAKLKNDVMLKNALRFLS